MDEQGNAQEPTLPPEQKSIQQPLGVGSEPLVDPAAPRARATEVDDYALGRARTRSLPLLETETGDEPEPEELEGKPTPNKVCVLGTLTLDETLVLDLYPEPGESAYANEIHTSPGGTSPNVSYVLAQLGLPPTFVGPHGDDDTGVMLVNSLAELSVDTWSCYPIKGVSSKKVIIALSPNGERTFLVHPGASLDDGDPVNLAKVLEHQIVYVDARRADILQTLRAQTKPPLIVATIQEWWRPDRVLPLLAYPDYILAKDRVIVQYENELQAALADPKHPLQGYVAISNKRGASAHTATGEAHVEALSFPRKDNTGAEEAFIAGILYGLTRGIPIEDGIHLGAILQGHAKTAIGGRAPFADAEIVRILIENSIALNAVLAPHFPEFQDEDDEL